VTPAVTACLLAAAVAVGLVVSSWLVGRSRSQQALLAGGLTHDADSEDLIAAVVAWVRSAVARWTARRDRERLGAFAVLLEVAARALRAGAPLLDAFVSGSEVAGPTVRADVERLERQVRSGLPLTDALQRWQQEAGDPDVDRIVVTTLIAVDLGGGTASAFESLSRAFSDRAQIAAEARALTSQARASATLLVTLPFLFVVVMSVSDPTVARALFGTAIGWVCVVGAVALNLVGGLWMRAMIRSVR
jgi:tight adherence protein B